MRVGIFAKTFPGETPGDVMRAARDAGYSSVQYNFACSGLGALPTAISSEAVIAISAASKETGVDVAAVSATYNMIHPDGALRDKGRRSFEAIAAIARTIGAPLLTVCTGSRNAADQWSGHPANHSPEAWLDMIDEFRRLIAIADDYDVLIGVEPELANVVNSADQARRLMDNLENERIRIVFDPANLFETEDDQRRGEIIDKAIDLLGDRIAIAHAKDRNPDGSFATAGKGTIDYPRYLASLRAAGFTGDLITHGLSASEAAGVATFLKSSLA